MADEEEVEPALPALRAPVSVEVVRAPIGELPFVQHPSHDTLVKRQVMPDVQGFDTRIYFEVAELEALLALAKSSVNRRVVLHGAQLVINVYVGKDGNQYEAWKFRGKPRAEGSLLDELTPGVSRR